jgi:hypothetical protein
LVKINDKPVTVMEWMAAQKKKYGIATLDIVFYTLRAVGTFVP